MNPKKLSVLFVVFVLLFFCSCFVPKKGTLQISVKSPFTEEEITTLLNESNGAIPEIYTALIGIQVQDKDEDWISLCRKDTFINIGDPQLNKTVLNEKLNKGEYLKIKLLFSSEIITPTPENPLRKRKRKINHENPKELIIEKNFIIKKNETISFSLNMDFRDWLLFSEDGSIILNPTLNIDEIDGTGEQKPSEEIGLTFSDEGIAVEGEENSVEKNISIDATTLPDDVPENLPDGFKNVTVAKSFRLTPKAIFKKPVTITAIFDGSTLINKDQKEYHLCYFHELKKKWIEMPILDIDGTSNSIRFKTNHFTDFKLLSGPYRLEHPAGISFRINYSLFNYYLNKILRTQHVDIFSFPHEMNESINDVGVIKQGDINIKFFGNNVSVRDFSFNISYKTENQIALKINNRNKIKLGTSHSTYSVESVENPFGDCDYNCDSKLDSCMANMCSGKHGLERDWCELRESIICTSEKIVCDLQEAVCRDANNVVEQLVNSSGQKWREYELETLSITMIFDVIKNENAPVTVQFNKESSLEMPNNIVIKGTTKRDEDEKGIAGQIHELDAYLITQNSKKIINKAFENELLSLLENAINMSLSGVYVNSDTQLGVDNEGILIKQGFALDMQLPDNSSQCAVSPNIEIPQTNPGDLTINNISHVGMGISLNVIEQLLAEFANRGYFCFNSSINSDDSLQITPTGAPAIDYLGSKKFRITFPFSIVYEQNGIKIIEDTGDISFVYLFVPNFSTGQFHFAFYQIQHNFSNEILVGLLDAYAANLKESKGIDFFLPYTNPMTFLGLQDSMFKAVGVDKRNESLLVDYKIEGLILDYAGEGKYYEWIWSKDHSIFENPSYSLNGTLNTTTNPVADYYIHTSNADYPNVFLKNRNVYSPFLIEYIGENINLGGGYSWIRNPWDENFNESNYKSERIFNCDNIINDHFYYDDYYNLIPKSNYMAQILDNFTNTTHLIALNITGDAVPEILQVIKENTTYSLKCYINNSISSIIEPVNQAVNIDLEAIGETSIWEIYTLDKTLPEYDHLVINGKEYKVIYASGSITLEEVKQIEDIAVINGSFEVYYHYSDGSVAVRNSSYKVDGNYSLAAGSDVFIPTKYLVEKWDYNPNYQPPPPPGGPVGFDEPYYIYNAPAWELELQDAYNNVLNFHKFAALYVDEHSIGGRYTISFFIKTSSVEHDPLYPGRNILPQNYYYSKGIWIPLTMPGHPLSRVGTSNISVPIEHFFGAYLKLKKIGGSCDPFYYEGNYSERVTILDYQKLTVHDWEEYEFTIELPYNTYCGMGIELDTRTNRRYWLDNFTITREP